MASCPFCHAPIDDVAARFGGRCPKCFIEIPGDEAPTNPSIKPPEPAPPKPNRAARAVLSIAGLALASSFCVWWSALRSNHNAQGASILSDSDFSSFYMVPLNDIETVTPKQELAANPKGTSRSTKGSTTSSPAQKNGSTVGAEPLAQEKTSASPANAAGSPRAEASKPVESSPTMNARGDIAIRQRQMEASEEESIDESVRKSVFTDVKNYSGQIQACYERRLKQDNTLKGSWLMSISVGTDGKPTHVTARGQQRKDAELEECMITRARTWRFQRLSESMTFEIPYRLGL